MSRWPWLRCYRWVLVVVRVDEEDVGGEKECRRLEEWTGVYMP